MLNIDKVVHSEDQLHMYVCPCTVVIYLKEKCL